MQMSPVTKCINPMATTKVLATSLTESTRTSAKLEERMLLGRAGNTPIAELELSWIAGLSMVSDLHLCCIVIVTFVSNDHFDGSVV